MTLSISETSVYDENVTFFLFNSFLYRIIIIIQHTYS